MGGFYIKRRYPIKFLDHKLLSEKQKKAAYAFSKQYGVDYFKACKYLNYFFAHASGQMSDSIFTSYTRIEIRR